MAETCGAGETEPGIWFCTDQSTRLVAHSHARTEFNLLMVGSLTYEFDDGELEVRAGQLLVLPQGCEHRLTAVSADAAFWVMELDVTSAPESPRSVATPTPERRRELVACLRKLWLRPDGEKKTVLHRRLVELLRNVSEGSESPVVSQHPAVQKAREICSTHLEGELEIAELAKRAGISESRLAHLFQMELGVTPLQYKNYVRLQGFIREEQRNPNDANLLRAALKAGFGSYPQFYRVFHQVCGAAPAAHLEWLLSSDAVDASEVSP